MRGELIALDLETTGLDPKDDAIIEFGAVRMRDGQILEEIDILINPKRPVPLFNQQLTGLTDAMLADQPTIEEALPRIQAFVGDALIVGQNILFDITFLQQYGVALNNPFLDTYEIASVVLPKASRYTLSTLSAHFGIDIGQAHRALDDARASALLYWALWQKLLTLPHELLATMAEIAQGVPTWPAKAAFEAAAASVSAQASAPKASDLFTAHWHSAPIAAPTAGPSSVFAPHFTIDGVTALFEADGAFSRTLPNYEPRAPQIEMARAVAGAFEDQHHLVVEAGTGTGKSLAYLAAAVLWSGAQQERVVISTHTNNLQDQLLQNDLPLVQAALGQTAHACAMKGRSHYLCPRRLAAARRRRPTSDDEMRTLGKVLMWLYEGGSGERGELSLRGPAENSVWQRLSAEDEDCTPQRCQDMMGGVCPFFRARQAADAADIVVVNHALLIADAQAEQRVLPHYDYVVIDEAHQLEEAVTQGLTMRVDEAMLVRRLADLGTRERGLLGDLLSNARGRAPDKDYQRFAAFCEAIEEATNAMRAGLRGLFSASADYMLDIHGNTYEFMINQTINAENRTQPGFMRAQNRWQALDEYFEVVAEGMSKLSAAMPRLQPHNLPNYGDLVSSISTAARHLTDLRAHLNAFFRQPIPNTIYWLMVGRGGEEIVVCAAPLHIGNKVEQTLWNDKRTVILTSATLRTQDDFNFLEDRLNADRIPKLDVGSPFNYRESTLLFLAEDIPDQTQDRTRYQSMAERGIVDLANALSGRVLVLFTSNAALRQTAQTVQPMLAANGLELFAQNESDSRQALLDNFKAATRGVLFGTRGFWEGVDIVGEALSAVVIMRLPFNMPTDPIYAARGESYGNSFQNYALPDAILRFRQGFGRLIRTTTDRGIVAVFDSRVITKGYGKTFVNALPQCTIKHGVMSELGKAARDWMARGGKQ
jgi:ATP-dependent DNA helicase DinG